MRKYMKPAAELIKFENREILTESNQCNCSYWTGGHNLGEGGACDEGTFADASEIGDDSTLV